MKKETIDWIFKAVVLLLLGVIMFYTARTDVQSNASLDLYSDDWVEVPMN